MDILLTILSWVVPLLSGWYVIPKLRARYVTDGKGGRTFELTAGESADDTEDDDDDDGDVDIGPLVFDAKKVDVRGLPAVVDVQVDESLMTCRVQIEGERDLALTISAELVDETLVLSSTQDQDKFVDEAHLPTVTITVPPGTALAIRAYVGINDVGDTDGPFKGTVEREAELNVGFVRGAELCSTGRGGITVHCVREELRIDSVGSGDIEVLSGKVEQLTATTTGSGDIWFGGTAIRADLSVVGSGEIDVSEVVEQPTVSVTGSGDISIDNESVV